MTDMPHVEELIRFSLTDELRRPGYGSHPMAGYCYIASEAYYHLMGGKVAGFIPCTIKHEGVTHWYLKHKSGRIIDITADQFKVPPDYSKGRGRGFLTKNPSKRAQIIMKRFKKTNDIAVDKVIRWAKAILSDIA